MGIETEVCISTPKSVFSMLSPDMGIETQCVSLLPRLCSA